MKPCLYETNPKPKRYSKEEPKSYTSLLKFLVVVMILMNNMKFYLHNKITNSNWIMILTNLVYLVENVSLTKTKTPKLPK